VYKKGLIPCNREEVTAVDGISLAIEKGTLFCLLGHNGAGKTTTISMLTGLFSPTSGDATIFGHSVVEDMDSVRAITGVCPQHDILWRELTAKEHLTLFAELKGAKNIDSLINQTLEDVRLTHVANVRVGTFSGGMKRRLSVAISGIGDPKIIFLDEPTTGMDPGNRRAVWDMIEKLKKNRVIFLTTHGMDEADMLSDRIAIMAHGTYRCIGSSLHLKNKFGVGYHISLLPLPEYMEQIKALVSNTVPGIILSNEAAGSLIYTVPNNRIEEITTLLRVIEQEARMLKDWSISHSTLEEVFLKLTKESNYVGGNTRTT